MSIFNRLRKKETLKEKHQRLEIEIAQDEKELEVLWEVEKYGSYLFGNRDRIVSLERKIVKKKKQLEFLKTEPLV